MKQQSAQQTTTQLSTLRIAYKNQGTRSRRKKMNPAKEKDVQAIKVSAPKEPLPLFDDYKFKAKDYDPL